MKIALLNTWDRAGGAAPAPFRLFQGLERTGCETVCLVRHTSQTVETIHALNDFVEQESFLERLVQQNYIDGNRTELSNTTFTFTLAGTDFSGYPAVFDADVINLHWVEKFLSRQSLVRLAASGRPLVWTLHDERPFTGGCHYSAGCANFQDGCLPCPQLRDDPFALPHKMLLESEAILRDADLTVVAPSEWLADQARQSRLFRDRRVEVIANGVETELFVPAPKIEAKKKLGLGSGSVALLFGAERHGEKRKGFATLMAAMRICLADERFARLCRQGELVILTVGDADGAVDDLGIAARHFGYINDDRLMVEVYSAADMFILPSLEDNLPNTMLEAMACGTPVVGFRTGGIPDLVRHGENGLLAGSGSAGELAAMILALVFDPGLRERFGAACRTGVLAQCTLARQAGAYVDLFRDLAGHGKGAAIGVPPAPALPPDRYDSLFGAALRFSLEKKEEDGTDLIACPVCPDPKQHQRYIDLRRSVSDLCRIHALRQPRRKLAAYRKVLKSFRAIK